MLITPTSGRPLALLLVVLACVSADKTVKSALSSSEGATSGPDKLDKLLQLDSNHHHRLAIEDTDSDSLVNFGDHHPHSPFEAENVDEHHNHEWLQRKAQANPNAQYQHSTSTQIDPVTGARRITRTSTFSSSSSSSSSSTLSSTTTTTRRPKTTTDKQEVPDQHESVPPTYSSTSSSTSFSSHQKSSYTLHDGVAGKAEASHSETMATSAHHATSGQEPSSTTHFHDESSDHQAYEHHETPEFMDENDLFDSGDDDKDNGDNKLHRADLPSSTQEPVEHTFEQSYIDTSDPLHPAQVHVRKEVKSVVGPNEASHSEHESKVSHSLDGTGSKSFKRKTSSSTSSYLSSSSRSSRNNGGFKVDERGQFLMKPNTMDSIELEHQHKERPVYKHSSIPRQSMSQASSGLSAMAHAGAWSHSDPARAYGYASGSAGLRSFSSASASSSSKFNAYLFNPNSHNSQQLPSDRNHKKRSGSAKRRAKKNRKARLDDYDAMIFDSRYH